MPETDSSATSPVKHPMALQSDAAARCASVGQRRASAALTKLPTMRRLQTTNLSTTMHALSTNATVDLGIDALTNSMQAAMQVATEKVPKSIFFTKMPASLQIARDESSHKLDIFNLLAPSLARDDGGATFGSIAFTGVEAHAPFACIGHASPPGRVLALMRNVMFSAWSSNYRPKLAVVSLAALRRALSSASRLRVVHFDPPTAHRCGASSCHPSSSRSAAPLSLPIWTLASSRTL
jgi:hypothetical protein